MAPSGEFLWHFFSLFLALCLPRYHREQWSATYSRDSALWCSEVLLEDFLLSRAMNPGLQPQPETYNGCEAPSYYQGCLLQWWYHPYMECIQELHNTSIILAGIRHLEYFSSWNELFSLKEDLVSWTSEVVNLRHYVGVTPILKVPRNRKVIHGMKNNEINRKPDIF